LTKQHLRHCLITTWLRTGLQEINDKMSETLDTTTAPIIEEKKELDLTTALKAVLKKASHHDGLVKGLRECTRAIAKKQAYFCVLAENCSEKQYKDLVTALCREQKIDVITVPDQKLLGEWVGLAKYDKQMKVRKQLKCSCVVVRDFGEESEELNFVLNDLKAKQQEKINEKLDDVGNIFSMDNFPNVQDRCQLDSIFPGEFHPANEVQAQDIYSNPPIIYSL